LLYRLLFLLYGEDRGLLPVADPGYDDYALRPLRFDIGQRVTNGDVFFNVRRAHLVAYFRLSRMIDKGDSSEGMPN
jgi:hypothetical protein